MNENKGLKEMYDLICWDNLDEAVIQFLQTSPQMPEDVQRCLPFLSQIMNAAIKDIRNNQVFQKFAPDKSDEGVLQWQLSHVGTQKELAKQYNYECLDYFLAKTFVNSPPKITEQEVFLYHNFLEKLRKMLGSLPDGENGAHRTPREVKAPTVMTGNPTTGEIKDHSSNMYVFNEREYSNFIARKVVDLNEALPANERVIPLSRKRSD